MSGPAALGNDLTKLAKKLLQDGPHKTEPTSRRVRVVLNHATIVDTTKAVHVWEHPFYPQFYVPFAALKNCTVKDKETVGESGGRGAAIVSITVTEKGDAKGVETDRAIRFDNDPSLGSLAGLIKLEFKAMDQWLEEDIPIYVHPKDPYKRVDILPSTRPIEIRVAGKTVAKSPVASHLFETGLPVRYYVPLATVDQSVLRKSTHITQCPYKGDAEYFNVVVDGEEFKNIVWYYRLPTHESTAIAGLVCFYNEKVDIVLDGEVLERPKTHFA